MMPQKAGKSRATVYTRLRLFETVFEIYIEAKGSQQESKHRKAYMAARKRLIDYIEELGDNS
jgi:ApbE superfamily uncharacterized protein (UPF0280 family)